MPIDLQWLGHEHESSCAEMLAETIAIGLQVSVVSVTIPDPLADRRTILVPTAGLDGPSCRCFNNTMIPCCTAACPCSVSVPRRESRARGCSTVC